MPAHLATDGRSSRQTRGCLSLALALAAVLLAALAAYMQLAPDASGSGRDATPTGELLVEPEADDSRSTVLSLLEAGDVSSVRLIGDSITVGYGCKGYGIYPDNTSVTAYDGPEGTYYEASSQVRCWANDFRAYATECGVTSFVNAGVSGFRMQYLAESPDSWLGDGADLVVVMLGTNDACHCSLDELHDYAETGLAAVAGRCQTLVVISPPDNARTDAVNLYGMDQVDVMLSEVCEEHGWLHVSLLGVLELGTSDYNEDQCHPTTAGSDKLWEALKTELGQMTR